MNTFGVAAARVADRPSSLDVHPMRIAPWGEPRNERWPGWARLTILLGGSALLWAGIAWAVLNLLKLI